MVSPFIDAVTSKKIIFLYAADPKQMVESFAPEVTILNTPWHVTPVPQGLHP